MRQFVNFKLENENYGIDVINVKEIVKNNDLTKIPGVPKFIKGIVNVRDEVIPVIDLKYILGISGDYHEDYKIIVIEANKKFGIIADKVNNVIRIENEEIIQPSRIAGLEKSYSDGIVKSNEELITILNINKIF